MKFVDLARQIQAYRDEIEERVGRVLSHGRFILGPEVEELEEELARFVGARGAVGASSGTDALLLTLLAAGVRPGDPVVTTPFTFIATAEVISLLGAVPVFADIEPETLNISCRAVEDVLHRLSAQGKRAKAIIAVSLYGQPPDVDELEGAASRHGAVLIEDACQSLGATYKGRRSGGLTLLSATSFFPAKPLGCFGDGGMAFSLDEALAERMKALRNHGQKKRYLHEEIGLNARLDTLQAAVLLVKLRHFEDELKAREEAAKRYGELLSGIEGLAPPRLKEGRTSAWAQYTVRIEAGKRDEVRERLAKDGIPTAVHYPRPLHLQPAFRALGYPEGSFPEAERAAAEVLSLPIHPFITEEEQERVAASLKAALSERSGGTR